MINIHSTMFVHCNIKQPGITVDKESLTFPKFGMYIINEMAFL